jgi:hypothetical protein
MVYKVVLEEMGLEELPSDPALVQPGKVYYVIFADDLTFYSLDVSLLPPKISEFKHRCRRYDMDLNAGKSKWVVFLPPNPREPVDHRDWKMEVDGDVLENVDDFQYLGFRLDCEMLDDIHLKMVNDRYIKAARVTGKLMRDLKCVSLFSLRKFYLSMVFSQLYGLVFLDGKRIEFERGVGIFFKTSLGLPDTCPHVVAVTLLQVKHVLQFQAEQRMKLCARWESRPREPVFDAFFVDRVTLFPRGVGLSASLGDTLSELDLPKTLDYRLYANSVSQALAGRVDEERRGRMLSVEGRAFWTELAPNGHLSFDLKKTMARLSFEEARIVFLLFADMLCWSALKKPSRKCVPCSAKFTTCHFFSCPMLFPHEEAWHKFVTLCRTQSWEDVLDLIFLVLRRWVVETPWFRSDFRLHVFSYVNMCSDVVHAAFRWNII